MLTFLALLATHVALGNKGDVLLRFRAQTAVDKPRIYLTDVAVCEGEICEESYGIDLGASPAPGSSSKVSVEAVLEVLQKEFPHVTVTTQGPKSVKVNATAEQISEAQILPYLNDALAAFNQQLQGFEVRVEKLLVPTNAKVRPGATQFVFSDFASAKLSQSEIVRKFSGTHPLRVELGQSLEATENVPGVRADYRLFVKQPLATRNIARGETLFGTMIEWQWQPYRAAGTAILAPRHGLISRRSIRRGSVLSETDFQPATVVSRGSPVKLELAKGEVVVRQSAIAQENGTEGQHIEVAIGKKRYRAKVINSELVRHEL